MKVLFLNQKCDFNLQAELPWNEKELTEDLQLDILFNAMSQGDEFLFDVAKQAIFQGLNNELATINYRQDILKDCLRYPSVIKDMYGLAVDAIEARKSSWLSIFAKHPSAILYDSVRMMEELVKILKTLRQITDDYADKLNRKVFSVFSK